MTTRTQGAAVPEDTAATNQPLACARRVSAALCAGLLLAVSTSAASDALFDGFHDPPNEARPRVWWHWMDGNVTEAGIRKDLHWMKRVGIGGVHTFDVAIDTPQVVATRLSYMSPAWRAALGAAVLLADDLDLELGIAASPGWSETGGPWVKPEDGMKKLVWTTIDIVGGKPIETRLPDPPSVPGPYQELAAASYVSGGRYYRDALVLAYPASNVVDLPAPSKVTSNEREIDGSALSDDDLATGVPIPAITASNPGIIRYDYDTPQTVRTVTVFVSGVNPYSSTEAIALRLQAMEHGGAWRDIANVRPTTVPTTISFSPVTASSFRLLFELTNPPIAFERYAIAPGVDQTAFLSRYSAPARFTLKQFALSAEARVNAFAHKAGFAVADDYFVLDDWVREDTNGIAPESVVDLSKHLSLDGVLRWTPPAGEWRVLRMGYSLTGKTNHPASAEATGLEVDKYDGEAVARYLRTYLGLYADSLRLSARERGPRSLMIDSIEVGPANWTPRLLEQFERLRGYDARPWLPALTGVIVGSRRRSDAFLYDFRRTLAELLATEHYATLTRIAHEHGLQVYGESLEGMRVTLGDDLEMRRHADIPMAALWTYAHAPQPQQLADVRGAASVAHVYGRTFVAAESLTSMLAPWAFAPSDLQPMIDAAFVHGLNRPVIHSSVHQPTDAAVPGLTLQAFGQHFNRHETWAEMAKPWMDYLARTSYLLQQGQHVADVAYFYGEEAPLGIQAKDHYFADAPTRYGYDFVSANALLRDLRVDQGELVSSGGARYRALYLGGRSQRMTVPVLRRLTELVHAGATIIGNPPAGSLSLTDDARAFSALVSELWSDAPITAVGRGRTLRGMDADGALATLGNAADFEYTAAADAEVLFTHRRTPASEIYFITNRRNRTEHLRARFRVAGKAPEIWRADTGAKEAVSFERAGSATVVPLTLLPHESFFVVFRHSTDGGTKNVPHRTSRLLTRLDRSWLVRFQPGRGAPATAELERLQSLATHGNPGIKYFSGVATYTTTFEVPSLQDPLAVLALDLGKVADVAEVRVNGQFAGTAWKRPYRVDVSSLVKPGKNSLEVKVANLWVNRLIGDAQPGARKIAFTAFPSYRADAPLRPSGLLGPVTLVVESLE